MDLLRGLGQRQWMFKLKYKIIKETPAAHDQNKMT